MGTERKLLLFIRNVFIVYFIKKRRFLYVRFGLKSALRTKDANCLDRYSCLLPIVSGSLNMNPPSSCL